MLSSLVVCSVSPVWLPVGSPVTLAPFTLAPLVGDIGVCHFVVGVVLREFCDKFCDGHSSFFLCLVVSTTAPRMRLPRVFLWRIVREQKLGSNDLVDCDCDDDEWNDCCHRDYVTRRLYLCQVIRQTFFVTLDIRTNVRKQKQALSSNKQLTNKCSPLYPLRTLVR